MKGNVICSALLHSIVSFLTDFICVSPQISIPRMQICNWEPLILEIPCVISQPGPLSETCHSGISL